MKESKIKIGKFVYTVSINKQDYSIKRGNKLVVSGYLPKKQHDMLKPAIMEVLLINAVYEINHFLSELK